MVEIKKKFFDVEVPVLEDKVAVLSTSPEELVGKIIKYDLTRILKGKNLVASLTIKKEGDKLTSETKNVALTHSYIARLMRKNVSYIEDSFVCLTKDGKLRLKPFLLTRNKVHRRIKTALRNKCREMIEEHSKERTNEEMFSDVISANLQKHLASRLKRIYPLALCEIRVAQKEK